MEQKKLISKFWLYRFIPDKFINYLDLIRFDKPVGFLLLMWPCWFSLALFNIKELKFYFLFFIGSFSMRSVGCIINDYIDRKIDKSVRRTAVRPLASGKVSFFEALMILIIFLSISFIVLLQFNALSILIGILSIPLVILYPFMKRFTYWPQLFLGIIFSLGAIISSTQINENINSQTLLIYIACIFWTLGYDTIYAYQDREDDIKIDLKSTALLFENRGKIFVMTFYFLFIFFISLAKNLNNLIISDIIISFIILIFLFIYIKKWKINSIKSSGFYFKNNVYIGLLIFLYLLN